VSAIRNVCGSWLSPRQEACKITAASAA